MTWEKYTRGDIKHAGAMRISRNGQLFVPKEYRFKGKFNILWDKDRKFVGIQPDSNGLRQASPRRKDGLQTISICSLLRREGIKFPANYRVFKENDIICIDVSKEVL